MKLLGALCIFMTLSMAYGLKCYSCVTTNPESCINTVSCYTMFDRCFSVKIDGLDLVTKGCQTSKLCVGPISCCEGDLCNSAGTAGPSIILLLASSAIILLFH